MRWLPHAKPSAASVNQISVGFYVPWDDASRTSLAAHIGQLDWLVTGGMSVTGPAHTLVTAPDPGLDVILAATPHRPKILPMVQNAVNDQWDGKGIAAMLHDPAQRSAFLARLEPQLAARHADGVVFDFEELPASAQHDYLRFLANARARFAPHHWMVTLAAPVDDPNWDLKSYGRIADRVFLMDYDEHTLEDEAGPIASQGWFVAQLNHALAAIPPAKAIVAIGNYAYDWTGTGKGDDMSVEEAWLAAHDSEAPIQFDRASGNAHFAYEEDGTTHNVWMLDAASAWNELRVADIKGVSGVALWRLGSEDAGYWKGLAAFQSGKLPDLGALNSVSNVDVEGNGEILRIADTPTTGNRALVQGRNGLIVDEQYKQLPTPYVVRRTGYQPKLVALTFDDGPDPDWTPRVLDILRAKQAPATFFVIGENALQHPLLLNRMVDQGHELGNHTYHPSQSRARFGAQHEDRAQRHPAAGRGLYRARHAPVPRALFRRCRADHRRRARSPRWWRSRGYTNGRPARGSQRLEAAGRRCDRPEPRWRRRAGRHAENRPMSCCSTTAAATAARPSPRCRRSSPSCARKGYTFVPVSQLAGLSRDAVMPPDHRLRAVPVRADIAIFVLLAALGGAEVDVLRRDHARHRPRADPGRPGAAPAP
jgi:spore germination protein YaaH